MSKNNVSCMKDFNIWNSKKKTVHGSGCDVYYHEREIWWCGFEEDGTGKNFDRPAVIMKGFGRHTCLVVPLTTSQREHHLRIFVGLIEGKEARALISQMRVVDTKRFVKKIGMMDKDRFCDIQKHVKKFF